MSQWRKLDAENVYNLVRTCGSWHDSADRGVRSRRWWWWPWARRFGGGSLQGGGFMEVSVAGPAEEDFADVGLEDMDLGPITADTILTRTTTTTTTTAAVTWSVAA